MDGGLTFAASGSGPLVWYPWPQAFVNTADSDYVWYGDDGGRFYEYDRVADDETEITSRLPFAEPAGMDMVYVSGVWQLRVISDTGEIAISEDDGATFSLVPGSGGLPAIDQRVFVSHPDMPELIATAPVLGGSVSYSPTLGKSWVQTALTGCDIRDLALTDGELYIACEDAQAMVIEAP
jgi:hypothetical protein